MVEIKNAAGRVIGVSQNLRGLIERARNFSRRVNVYPLPYERARLSVHFSDGSYCHTEFASHTVCLEFCAGLRWTVENLQAKLEKENES